MKSAFILMGMALALGCALPKREYSTVPRVPWAEGEYAKLEKRGTNTVSGQAFLKTRGGDVKTCAGETVILSPVTSNSTQFFDWQIAGKREPYQKMSEEADGRVFQYLKQVKADASGRFIFYDVPAGDYYLYTLVKWEAPSGYGLSQQGGWVGSRVTVKAGERNDFILTR